MNTLTELSFRHNLIKLYVDVVTTLTGVENMVKSRLRAETKMKDRVRIAGPELKAGMSEAKDPLEVISQDIANKEKKLMAGVNEGIAKGHYKQGIEKARARNSWKLSQDRASRHYEERADDMVKNAMETYDIRAQAIENAKGKVKDMPTTTRDQRIAKSNAYLKAVSEEMDKAFGRK